MDVLSVEDYLKLSKAERVALYKAREEDEIAHAHEDMAEDLEHEPEHLKKKHEEIDRLKKKVIYPCHWVADDESRTTAAALNVSPYRCPHFDSSLLRCTSFEDGWLDCEEIALKIKLQRQKGVN